MQLPKIIYIMGSPGAGKGTQAELLARAISYHQFSTGDAFREIAAQDSELGRRVKETIDNGILAPPALAAEIVMAAAQKHLDAGHGLVFDGTPRTIDEAILVDKFFLERHYGQPLVIFLNVDKDEMMRRNTKRRFCLGIQGGFAVMSVADEERCTAAGGTVGIRPDDEPGKFDTRWEQFQTRTYPVIEAYRQQQLLHEIDGTQSIEAVHAAITARVGEFTRS